MNVIIEVTRDGYSVDQVYETMSVIELIEWLEQFDPEARVYTSHDQGYTFGGISEDDFREENDFIQEEL